VEGHGEAQNGHHTATLARRWVAATHSSGTEDGLVSTAALAGPGMAPKNLWSAWHFEVGSEIGKYQGKKESGIF
jgi:hypothetical protein